MGTDKTLAQATILLAMLGLASAAAMIYVRYAQPNTPQSQAEQELYAQSAASLFSADIYGLISDPYTASYFLSVQPDKYLTGWVCADFIDLTWAESTDCSDMQVHNNTVTRDFTATIYYYYTVMVYVPAGTTPLNLTFDWWVNTNQPAYIWMGAFIIQGDAFTTNGELNVIEIANFTWSYNSFGNTSGTYTGLTIAPGNTLAVLVETLPSYAPQISFGFTYTTNIQDTLKVILPSKYYEASLTQQNRVYGTEPGPMAVFKIPAPFQGKLEIYYNNTLVAQQDATFKPGEEIFFYPSPAYYGNPQTTLLLNLPVTVKVSNMSLTVTYGGAQATITLKATLIGGGTSSAWLIMLVGCQKTCTVTIEPAKTKQ